MALMDADKGLEPVDAGQVVVQQARSHWLAPTQSTPSSPLVTWTGYGSAILSATRATTRACLALSSTSKIIGSRLMPALRFIADQ